MPIYTEAVNTTIDGMAMWLGAVPAGTASEENQLVSRAQQGDREAFAALARRYAPLLRTMLLGKTHHLQDAEDLMMESLALAWRDLPQLREPDRFKGWLFAIGRNRWSSWIRRRPLTPEAFDQVKELAVEGTESSGREETQRVLDALRPLSEAYRLPLWLFHIEGYSAAEIAERLGSTPQAIRQRLSRGLRLVRRSLGANL